MSHIPQLNYFQVKESDSGVYQCQANVAPGSWETRYTVLQLYFKLTVSQDSFFLSFIYLQSIDLAVTVSHILHIYTYSLYR